MMLIRLSGYTGSDKDALFDGDVLESRWRALFKVDKYAVVGAPDGEQSRDDRQMNRSDVFRNNARRGAAVV